MTQEAGGLSCPAPPSFWGSGVIVSSPLSSGSAGHSSGGSSQRPQLGTCPLLAPSPRSQALASREPAAGQVAGQVHSGSRTCGVGGKEQAASVGSRAAPHGGNNFF